MIDGNQTGYVPRDYQSFPLGSDPLHTKQWDLPLLTLQEAKERSEQLIADGIDPLSQAVAKNCMPTFQNGYGYCWAHAAAMAMKLTFTMRGQDAPRLSATAMAAKVKNYRDRGGNAFESFPFMAEHGLPTVDIWPENEVSRSLDTNTMRDVAQKHRAIEWYELPDRSDEHKWTALCNGFVIWTGYSNIGHAMLAARFDVDNRGNPRSWDINSWNRSASEASQWQSSWLEERNTVWKRAGRDFTCFEQYALREVTVI